MEITATYMGPIQGMECQRFLDCGLCKGRGGSQCHAAKAQGVTKRGVTLDDGQITHLIGVRLKHFWCFWPFRGYLGFPVITFWGVLVQRH